MWSNVSQAQGHNHFTQSAGSAMVHMAQDPLGIFCCQGTLQALVQLPVCQDPQVLFGRAASQPGSLQPVLFVARGSPFPAARLCICGFWFFFNFIRLLTVLYAITEYSLHRLDTFRKEELSFVFLTTAKSRLYFSLR